MTGILLVERQGEPSAWELGRVKWYNRTRGFGLLTRGEGTLDIFIEKSVLEKCGVDDLQPHERLDVRYVLGNRGSPVAVEVAYPRGFVW